MQVADFLSAVLPPEGMGFYCAAELSSRAKEHKFVTTLKELHEAAVQFDADKKDTYFALAVYGAAGSRTAANSTHLKCLFADIDIGEGKPYKNPENALAAVDAWSEETLGVLPLIIYSGYGLHAYWPLSEAVPMEAWRVVAENFKRACSDKGLGIDFSVSSDSARVLRFPGTANRKRSVPKPVEILRQASMVQPLSYYSEKLGPYASLISTRQTSVSPAAIDNFLNALGAAPEHAKKGASFVTELSEVSQFSFERIENLGDKGCLQIMSYINNPTKDGSEPLWRACISVAKFCAEGEEKAHQLAALHPYDRDRTIRKLAEIKGPYGCEAFSGIQPGVCEKCVHYGKIKNPILLAREAKQQEAVQIPVEEKGKIVVEERPAPPEGFSFHASGIKMAMQSADGIVRFVNVCDTVLYAVATYDRNDERFVQFIYFEHAQKKTTMIPLHIVTSKDDSIKAFSRVGVLVNSGQENAFRAYLKASVTLAKQKPPIRMPTSLGWQEDGSFAFDNRLFYKDGEVGIPAYGFENIADTTGVVGTLDNWRLVVSSLIRLERWDILSMMAVGFAAPLMRFTGLNGVTFHICSNGSGHGKTLCQRLASSIWGVPDKFRTTPSTSAVAMVNRLGLLGTLPLMVDEITHKGRNDLEWFPEFLSQMSDGRGKDRMEASTNTERRNTTTWSSIALMTSNKHMMDYLTAERAHGSEGEIRRLVELVFEKEFVADELTKTLLFQTLPENYGVAGEAYAKWLVRNEATARNVTKETYAEVFDKFDATGDERFWIAGCASVIAGLRLVSSKYAGIVDLPIGKIATFLYNTIVHMRSESRKMRRTAEDILNEFTKKHFGKLVFVNGRMAKLAGVDIAETFDRRDVCGRVEKGAVDGWLDYWIEERELKAFCSSMSYGYSEFKKDISRNNSCVVVGFKTKDLLANTKGPSLAVKCIHLKQSIQDSPDIFNIMTRNNSKEIA
jgi:Domain of unknown function (DUF927)